MRSLPAVLVGFGGVSYLLFVGDVFACAYFVVPGENTAGF